jgi:hypothetical protein
LLGVYLLYADESGDLTDPSIQFFVVGAVAVHEDAVRPLAGAVNAKMESFVGRKLAAKLELHGSPMRVGAGAWGQVGHAKRIALYHQLMQMLGTWEHSQTSSKIECFAMAMDRNYSQSPTETTYGELLYAFDEAMRTKRKGGDPHNGVLIADHSRYETTLQAWWALARAKKSRPQQDPRSLYAVVEVPLFVDSHLTRLMQLADLVAHAFYRGHSANDWAWANSAMGAFSEPARLMHFTSDKSCGCPACTLQATAKSGVGSAGT